MSETTIKMALDYANLNVIVDVMKANLIALPEHYIKGFEDYVLSLADGLDDEAANEFWHDYICLYAKYNVYELESIHNFWVDATCNDGWSYAREFNIKDKKCPLLINYSSLSFEEQSLVRLFAGAIWALVIQDDVDQEIEPDSEELSQDIPE